MFAYSFMLLQKDGTLLATGENRYGLFGNGTTSNLSSLTPIASNVKMFSVAIDSSLIIKNDNKVYVAGYNYYGQLGLGDNENRTTFTEINVPNPENIKKIASGGHSFFLIYNDGTIWATGYNSRGQFGLGHHNDINEFTKLPITNVRDVFSSGATSFILKNDGSLWGAGANNYGQLNRSAGSNQSDDQLTFIDTNLTNIKRVDCGNDTYFYLKNDGTLYSTGINGSGQLGLNSSSDVYSITKVDIDSVVKVAAGSNHTLIVQENGNVRATGYGSSYELGQSSNSNQSSFRYISGIKGVDVSAGYNTTYILCEGNKLYVCGKNSYGQLGTGSTSSSVVLTTIGTYDVDGITLNDPAILTVVNYLIKSLEKYYTIDSSNVLIETTADLTNGIELTKIIDNIDLLPNEFSLVTNNEKNIGYSGIISELILQSEQKDIPNYSKVISFISKNIIDTNNCIKFIFKINDIDWYTYNYDTETFENVFFNVDDDYMNEDSWNNIKQNILTEGINISDIDKLSNFFNSNEVTQIKFAIVLDSDNINNLPVIKNIDNNVELNGSYIELKDNEYSLKIISKKELNIIPTTDLEKIVINII